MKAYYICGVISNAKSCYHNSTIFSAHYYEYVWTLYAVRHPIFSYHPFIALPLFPQESTFIFHQKTNFYEHSTFRNTATSRRAAD